MTEEMIGLFAHREETEVLAVDMESTSDVNVGPNETLQDPAVTVYDWRGGEWVDVTAEFHVMQIQVSGTKVQWQKGAAQDATEQKRGRYLVKVEVDTDQGRTLIETPSMLVGEQGASTS